MEAMSVEQRLERLEKLAGITGPAICPDPTGEGSAWQGEAVRSVPVGWVKTLRHIFTSPSGWRPLKVRGKCVGAIEPDPSIPWGEEYEAILPEEARDGDEYFNDGWAVANDVGSMKSWFLTSIPWRRRKSPAPAEPAPGSDAEHPPIGYRLAKVGDVYAKGYLIYFSGVWTAGGEPNTGRHVLSLGIPVANPIPANEGDSQKAESGVMQKKLDLQWEAAKVLEQERNALIAERAELRATVERLTAENAALDAQRNDAIKSRNQYRKELEELEEKMDAIKELAG